VGAALCWREARQDEPDTARVKFERSETDAESLLVHPSCLVFCSCPSAPLLPLSHPLWRRPALLQLKNWQRKSPLCKPLSR
jgi:hypothetical protein